MGPVDQEQEPAHERQALRQDMKRKRKQQYKQRLKERRAAREADWDARVQQRYPELTDSEKQLAEGLRHRREKQSSMYGLDDIIHMAEQGRLPQDWLELPAQREARVKRELDEVEARLEAQMQARRAAHAQAAPSCVDWLESPAQREARVKCALDELEARLEAQMQARRAAQAASI